MSEKNDVKPPVELTTIVGRLGGNPVSKIIASKLVDVANFRVGVYKKGFKNESPSTRWIDVAAFDDLKEVAMTFKKGDQVEVTGVLTKVEGKGKYEGRTFERISARNIKKRGLSLYKGNVTADVELKSLKGLKLLEINIAKTNLDESTSFKKATFFGDKAEEFAKQKLKKGDFIKAVGYEKLNNFVNKDGEEVSRMEMSGVNLEVLSRKEDRNKAKAEVKEKSNSL